MTLIEQIRAARACSTPLLAINASDQLAIAKSIASSLNGDVPVVGWDRTNGFMARNKAGISALQELCSKSGVSADELPIATCEAHNALRYAAMLPAKTVIIALSLNRFLHEESSAQTIQAILNLRDKFKSDQRTLIGLSPSFDFPAEIQHDVILLEDPLPTDEDYAGIVTSLCGIAKLKAPSKDLTSNAVRAVRGLSAFEAEQVIAMAIASTSMKHLDLSSAWKLKVSAVSKIRGLTMTLDGPNLSDLRGLDNVVGMLNGLWLGPEPPELVVRVDEIDKAMGGLSGPGDNTGVSQDLLQQFLVNMEDNGWIGAILVGIRGSGKTVLTQSIGVKHGVPTISMDAGQMKGKHVGESEQAFREAFRTFKSIGGKNVLVLATCNKLDILPPELLRRFKLGIVYFDLLTPEERDSLWPVYLKKYGHDLASERPNDEGWTGAEIRNCCEIAYKLRKTVKEVGSTYIVPVTKSDPNSVNALRTQAENRFLSASYPGVYRRSVELAGALDGRTFN